MLINISLPERFKCPLTNTLMVEPVTTVEGQTYEKEAIEENIAQHRIILTAPLIPQQALAQEIAAFVNLHQAQFAQALLQAAQLMDTKTVKILLRLGVEAEKADDKGWTALHYLCWQGQQDLMTLLVKQVMESALAQVNIESNFKQSLVLAIQRLNSKQSWFVQVKRSLEQYAEQLKINDKDYQQLIKKLTSLNGLYNQIKALQAISKASNELVPDFSQDSQVFTLPTPASQLAELINTIDYAQTELSEDYGSVKSVAALMEGEEPQIIEQLAQLIEQLYAATAQRLKELASYKTIQQLDANLQFLMQLWQTEAKQAHLQLEAKITQFQQDLLNVKQQVTAAEQAKMEDRRSSNYKLKSLKRKREEGELGAEDEPDPKKFVTPAEKYYQTAENYLQQQQYAKAIKYYGRAILLQPKWGMAYVQRSKAYQAAKKIDQVAPDLLRGLSLAPKEKLALEQLSPLMRALGNNFRSYQILMLFKEVLAQTAAAQSFNELSQAIFYGEDEKIKQAQAAITLTHPEGYILLHIAALAGRLEMMKYLIEQGAAVNALTKSWKFSPLLLAAMLGHVDCVHYLIEQQADIHQADKDGATPLYCSVHGGHLEIVKYLIEKQADVNKTNNSWTPLAIASRFGYLEIVKCLIAAKADLNQANSEGTTPLLEASQQGYEKIAKYLFEKGADINQANDKGLTPLGLTIKNGYLELAKYFIEQQLDVKVVQKNGESLLAIVVGEGQLELARYLVEERQVDVDQADNKGITALHLAIVKGHTALVKYLIEHHADINLADSNKETPLYKAVAYGQLEMVKYLLAQHADIQKTDKHRTPLLYVAIREKQITIAKYLVDLLADVNEVMNSYTPLHYAVDCRCMEVIKYLVEKQADINKVFDYKGTPLKVAVGKFSFNFDIVKYLIEQGADVNKVFEESNAPLFEVIDDYSIRSKVVQYLIEHGADVNQVGSWYSSKVTPLHLAIQRNSFDTVKCLVEHGADVNKGSQDRYQVTTPLAKAISSGKFDIAKYLIEKGADVNQVTGEILCRAVENGGLELIKLIIEKQVNINQVNESGKTALYQAAEMGHSVIVKHLLEQKANPNQAANDGDTPLAIAVQNNHLTTVRYLILKQAGVNQPGKDGFTALHWAVEKGYLPIAKLLLRYQANINAVSANNSTPLHLAAKQGNLPMAKLLVEHKADLNQGLQGCTPLAVAIKEQKLMVAEYLLRQGTDVYLKPELLHEAVQLNLKTLIELLIIYGAGKELKQAEQDVQIKQDIQSRPVVKPKRRGRPPKGNAQPEQLPAMPAKPRLQPLLAIANSQQKTAIELTEDRELKQAMQTWHTLRFFLYNQLAVNEAPKTHFTKNYSLFTAKTHQYADCQVITADTPEEFCLMKNL